MNKKLFLIGALLGGISYSLKIASEYAPGVKTSFNLLVLSLFVGILCCGVFAFMTQKILAPIVVKALGGDYNE